LTHSGVHLGLRSGRRQAPQFGGGVKRWSGSILSEPQQPVLSTAEGLYREVEGLTTEGEWDINF